MNLSFAGCGFLGIYHVGVASCFREYAPHVLVSKIAGASVGSIAATALICDVSLGQTTTDILSVAVKARSRTLGPLNPRFDLNSLIKEGLERSLPQDAHLKCSGRLFISVTRWSDKKNVLLSEFNTRDELIQAILCSCFIPCYSGMTMPSFQGVKYVDGGLSDNLPVLDENTISVSPFAGEHDICPQDESCNILQVNLANTSIAISPGNLYRLCRILFPPKPEILSKMCQQGFDDALKFLQRKNVIACTRCLGVQSSLSLAENESETSSDQNYSSSSESNTEHVYDNCAECRKRRHIAHYGSLPEAVVTAIQDVCEQFNKSFANWFYNSLPMKLMSVISIPYMLQMDFTIAVFNKIYEQLPEYRKDIKTQAQAILSYIKYYLKRLDKNRHVYSAKFSCQLAITEMDYTEEDVNSSYTLPADNTLAHETCTLKIEEERVPKRKTSFKIPEPSLKVPSVAERRQHRKSYAGFSNIPSPTEKVRRKSVCEAIHPERVIRNMKFGFTVDLVPTVNAKDKKTNVVEALQSLGEEDNELNVIELTNKALGLEREYISQHQNELSEENADTLDKIFSAPDNEALMSYYYVDEDNKSVKITELYNVTDADTSIILTDEERKINNELQWEKDWVNNSSSMLPNTSITDTLDDNEFDTSDVECDLDGSVEIPQITVSEPDSNDFFIPRKPSRKQSFIIVK